ncbi:MAG: hypothetical protein MUO26_13465 [Methanotrichaceae archaeon]|nr:hypothetical protein [Methanotrichaceae archaeon]
MDTTESETGKKKRVSGWLSIKSPDDVEKAITRAINKILASSDCINHVGKIASLANAWVNVRRLAIDAEEVRGIKDRLTKLEEDLTKRVSKLEGTK